MRKVWAIVRLTIAESIRTRIAIAFVVLLVGMMVLLIATATGDGTVPGKIQMFLSYSMGTTYFLLSLLVIFLACRTLDQDIKTQRIDSIVCKPLSRGQLLLGRWLGIVILAFALLLISMSVTYGMVRLYTKSAMPDDEKAKMQNQVLVARKEYQAPPPDVSKDVEKRVKELNDQGEFPKDKPYHIAIQNIEDEFIRQSRTVNPMNTGTWTFKVKKPQEGNVKITLRFKYQPSIDTSADYMTLHRYGILGQWTFGKPNAKNAYSVTIEKMGRILHELDVPLNTVETDGTLILTFKNVDPRQVTVHFPLDDGLEILVHEGTFGPNFIRTWILIFFAILFMATLALACGTFLSFPIASLVTLSIYFIGIGRNFLYDAIGAKYGISGGTNILETIEKVITYVSIQLVPFLDIGEFTTRLIDGKIIEWSSVAAQFATLVVLKTGLIAIFAVAIFNRRELGKITV